MFRIGFADESALLKHELAYCLGQMKKTSALPVLEQVLRDEKEDPMVRHEVCDHMNQSYPKLLRPSIYLFMIPYSRFDEVGC